MRSSTALSAQRQDFRFLWVTDFPMFEYDEKEKRWNAAHHPFTSPHDHDMEKLEIRSRLRCARWPMTLC